MRLTRLAWARVLHSCCAAVALGGRHGLLRQQSQHGPPGSSELTSVDRAQLASLDCATGSLCSLLLSAMRASADFFPPRHAVGAVGRALARWKTAEPGSIVSTTL